MLPGLACNAFDFPGQHTIRYAASRGYRCVLMERRGQWRPLESARFNIFGDAADLEEGIAQVRRMFPDAPLFLSGTSAGSALSVSALGKFDARRRAGDFTAPHFVAVASLFPGFDIAPGGCLVQSEPVFSSVMLHSMKSQFVKPNESVLRACDSQAVDLALQAPDPDAFVDAVTSFAGYPSGREAYDAGENPVRFVESIDTPLLVLLSADDPISVLSNFTEAPRGSLHRNFQEAYKWSPELAVPHEQFVPHSANMAVCVTSSGSHCPMLDGYVCPFRLTCKSLASWHDEALFDFFDMVYASVSSNPSSGS